MPLTHLNDFPDRLSPMLIKELRQGLRTRGFTMTFLIFQCLLALIILITVSSPFSTNSGSAVSGVLFTIFGIAALILQPLRGVTALSGEITGNTIEMMVLTRLTASRIVIGKWSAISSQTALMLMSIVPYFILRFFFGGMNLLGEIVFLLLIFTTSLALTAVMVGLSATAARVARLVPVVIFVMGMSTIPSFLFRRGLNEFMTFCSMPDWESRLAIALYLLFISYFAWCSLSLGISAIAPAAENHSTPRRVVTLALLVLAASSAPLDSVPPAMLLLACAIIIAPSLAVALTEPTPLLPPLCRPFLRRGLPGKLAALFLLPGWPAGVFFVTLTLALSAAMVALSVHLKSPATIGSSSWITLLSITGGILLPALCSVHFTKDDRKRFNTLLVFLIILLVIMSIPPLVSSINGSVKIHWWFSWNPWVILAMQSDSAFDSGDLLLAAAGVDAILLLALVVSATRAYRGYFPVFEEATRNLPVTPSAHPSAPPVP